MDFKRFDKKSVNLTLDSTEITFESSDQRSIVINLKNDTITGFLIVKDIRFKIDKIILQSKLELNKRLTAIYIKDQQKVIIYRPGLFGGGNGASRSRLRNNVNTGGVNMIRIQNGEETKERNASIIEKIKMIIHTIEIGDLHATIVCVRDLREAIKKPLNVDNLEIASEYSILKEIIDAMDLRIKRKLMKEDLVAEMSEYALNLSFKLSADKRRINENDLFGEIKSKIMEIKEFINLHSVTLIDRFNVHAQEFESCTKEFETNAKKFKSDPQLLKSNAEQYESNEKKYESYIENEVEYPFIDFDFRLVILQSSLEDILTNDQRDLRFAKIGGRILKTALKMIPYFGNLFDGDIIDGFNNLAEEVKNSLDQRQRKNLFKRYKEEIEKHDPEKPILEQLKQCISNKDLKNNWVIIYHNLVVLDQSIAFKLANSIREKKECYKEIFDQNFKDILNVLLTNKKLGDNYIKIYFKLACIILKYKDEKYLEEFKGLKDLFPPEALLYRKKFSKNIFIKKEIVFRWCENKIKDKIVFENYESERVISIFDLFLDKCKQIDELKISLNIMNDLYIKKSEEIISSFTSLSVDESLLELKQDIERRLKLKKDEVLIVESLKNISKKHQEELKKAEELDFDCYVEPICVKNENLSLYLNSGNDRIEHSVESVLNDFLNSKKSILLIIGMAGSGKTFCLNKLEQHLLEKNKIPVLIQLGCINNVSSGIIEDYFNKMSIIDELLESHNSVLKDKYKSEIIFMLDAYDESHCDKIKSCQIFNPNLKMDRWLMCKFIVTCRNTSSVFNSDNYWKYFTNSRDILSEIRLLAFNIEKRIDLFEKLSQKYDQHMNVKDLDSFISNNPFLSAMNQTPFMLKVIFTTLQANSTEFKFDEYEMIENYIKKFIDRGVDKLLKSGAQVHDCEQRAINYCKKVAKLMMKNNSNSLNISKDSAELAILDLIKNENKMIFDLSPFMFKDKNTIEFLTINIYEFFKTQIEIELNESDNQKIEIEENTNVRNILVDINFQTSSPYTFQFLKNNKQKHIDHFKCLEKETDKKKIIRILKLLIGVEISTVSISDQEELKIIGDDQVCISNLKHISTEALGKGYIEALVDGSILIRKENELFIIKDKNDDITRTLIPSYSGGFLVNYTDKGFLNLFFIKDFRCINEIRIAENVSSLISAKFSEDDKKLFISYQEKADSKFKIFNLVDNFFEIVPEITNKKQQEYLEEVDDLEIMDILISPGPADYMIVLKEFFSFEIYFKNQLIRKEVYGESDQSLSQRLLDKIKLSSKYNKGITMQQKILEKTEQLSNNYVIQDSDKQCYEIYVNIQAMCEQLISNYLSSSKISNFVGFIHTDLPATPLRNDILTENKRSAIVINQRENVKRVIAVGTRTKIINSLLKNPKTTFYCIYPKNNYNLKELNEKNTYQKNLNEFTNLHDYPLDNIDKIQEEFHGATYFFQDLTGKHYCFSLKGRQVNDSTPKMDWGIWFGEISIPVIKDRCQKVAQYFQIFGFKKFYEYLITNSLLE